MRFRYDNLQEKVLLYVDNMLLLLGDTDTSLRAAMSTIADFVKFSGLTTNWSKSDLLPLDRDAHSQMELIALSQIAEKKVLVILDNTVQDTFLRKAASKALFQARRLIL